MAAHGITTQIHFLPTRSGSAPARGLWARLSLMLKARRTRRMLAEMDDHMLADIGVSRADAQMEASRPAWDLADRG